MKNPLNVVAIVFINATCPLAMGALVIHEPFAQASGALSGTGGTGITSWTSTSTDVETTTSLSYGEVGHTDGQVEAVAGGSGGRASATINADLSNAGLLDNGATLWFSTVFQGGTGGSNQHSGFAFGDASVTGAHNGLNMTGGNGLGFYFRQNNVRSVGWNTGSRTLSGSSLAASASGTQLIVGRIDWGADAISNEVLTIFVLDPTNGTLLETTPTSGGVSVSISAFNQTLSNTISFANRDSGSTPQIYDEISFGSSFSDVNGVPEPGASFLLGLASLSLIVRRTRSA